MDIKYVKDNAGNNFFPVVHEKGVVDDNGTTLESKLQSKQDAISDLSTIRSGAAAGATAVQPATTLAGYGITDGYTKTEGQALENTVDNRLDDQDAAIALLNGSEVIVVADHTQVASPNSQKIYREQGSTSYTDWMYQDSTWKEIATYDFPGVDDEPTAGSSNLVKSGGVYNEVSQLGQIVSESFDSYNVLTAYQSGLAGYVSADLTFGSFGTHSIYLLPDSNLVYAIDVNYPGGSAYYYTLTDENDNILEQVKSADIFGSETSGIKRWIFKINPNAAKIYVSYNPSVIQLFGSSVVDLNNEIFKRLSFGNFEVSNVEYKGETGNQVLSSSNSCLQTKFSNGKPVLEYEATSVSVCRLFDIAAINQNGWRYIYISLPYIVEHQDIDARYVNLVVLDGQNNVISATIIKGSIIQVPYKCRVLLVGKADAVVYEGCNVEKINTQAIKQLDDKTIIISYIDVSPASVGAAGYVSNSNVGTTISFGGWFKHNVYNIEGNKKYKITINKYPNGGAYAYAITDSADKILQIVTSGQIFGDDHTTPKSFIFNSFANQAKLYVTCVTTASDDVIVQLQNRRDINVVVNELDAQRSKYFFTKKDFACDGDSMVQWPQYTDEILNFNSLSKNSMGGATCCDRSVVLNNITYVPQWAPDCTTENPFVDYMDLSELTPDTPEYAQATANNCIFGHLGRFIDKVANSNFPSPNIFVMNIMGVNDTWSTQSIDAIIGTFDNAISGSYDQLTRNTILNAVRWFVTKFRITYPNCKLFWKTSTQQTADNHTYFYKIEEELLKLLRFLSVPIIDSYAEVGIMRELEHANGQNNQWTTDGTHPTSAGYQMDGEFVASKLKAWFCGYYEL